MVGFALAQAVTIFADIYLHFLYGFRTGALLRKNMLTRILDRPGARAVPQSPGEAISRFRDDVNNAADFTCQIPFIIGQALFAVIALVTMLRISVRVTLFAYIPFVVVILVANWAMKNVEKYREANRKASGQGDRFHRRGVWLGPGGQSGHRRSQRAGALCPAERKPPQGRHHRPAVYGLYRIARSGTSSTSSPG